MTRRHRSLHVFAAVVALTLAGCAQATAHRVPGTDMALPAGGADQLIASLIRQCEISRVPASAAEDRKRQACAHADTAAGDAGTVTRVPARVP